MSTPHISLSSSSLCQKIIFTVGVNLTISDKNNFVQFFGTRCIMMLSISG